ncbi:UNVERIFIED_CONTAM: hypothetical protein HDU68_011389 [Siphonaria sp. JEL0065]|nr:hypothetical protein HDU68_011389 [Siphonaria sp. JEL0065]
MTTRNTNIISDALAQAQFAEKKWVWVHEKSEGYIAGWIVEEKGEQVVVEFQDGSKQSLNVNDTEKMNPPKFDKVEDMASLTYLNEASVIHNLRLRYYSNSIYTYSGLFLVAVNPYKKLPIYNDEAIKAYRSKKRSEMPPHIYAIADAAYYEMIQNKESQSILITGESGAGKTENTKKVIQYLAAISPSNSSGGKQGSLEQQIILANPILESFGNAQTIRNNNSSRFGKFIRLEFNAAGQICSANIERYLLEKSRVTHQTSKERNYHIFYQLMKGADAETKKNLLLDGGLNDYMFLKDSKKEIEGVDDASDFKALTNAMSIMRISEEEQFSLYRVISAILNLGNIQVVNDRDDQAQLTEIGHSVVEKVCHVLGISVPEFTKSLLKPKIKAGRDWVTQARDVNQVLYSVEALARALYERMFGKLVDRINETISNPSSKSSFIGVLDIAGFEIFDQNSFEQLCINYTNEKLQQFFNHHMFIIEQEEYHREGIEWKFIDFGLDLQPTIDLIEKTSPIGVLSCLDEECVMPKATDRTFLDKLHSIWKGKSSKYEAPRFNTGFALHHYAGKVEYDVNGWLDKNKDPLNETITKLLATSSEKFVASLFSDSLGDVDDLKGRGVTGITKKGAFRTVGQRHKEQLLSLMSQLYSTEPHFVRCIVPNDEKKPGKINVNQVLEQLRCNGVLEGIRICRAGFPNRLTFADFRQRYELLSPGVIPKGFMDGKSGAQLLLESLALDRNQYRIGNSKVFFRNGVLADLEERRDEKLEKIVIKIQAIARGYIARRQFKKRLDRFRAIRIIQKNARIYVTLREWSWWKLYTKVKPLLNVTRTDVEMRKREELAKEWEDRAKREADEKAKLEAIKTALENEKRQIESILIQEKNAAANQAEILSRTQKREVLLTEQLSACAADLEQREVDLENLVKTKKALESELRNTVNILKDQKDHCERVEKDRTLKEDQINELEFKIKLEIEKSERLESDKKALEKEAGDIQSNLDNVNEEASGLLRQQNKLKSSITELEQRLESELEERKRLDQRKAQLETELQQLNASYSSLAKSNAELESALKRKESDSISLGEKLQQEISERESSDKQRRELQSKLSTAQTELESQIVERTLLKKSKLKLESELESMTRLVEEKGSEEHKQGELRKLRESELSDLKNQLSAAQSETELLRKTSGIAQDKLNVELDTVRGELLTMSKLKSSFEKQAQELSSELEHVQESHSRLEKFKRQLDSDFSSAKAQNDDLNLTLTELKLTKENLESKLASVSSRLEESESNVSRLERERQSLSRQLESIKDELEEEKKRSASIVAQNKRLGIELADARVNLEEASLAVEETNKKLSSKTQDLDILREKYNQDVLGKAAESDEIKRRLDSQILDLDAKIGDLERNCQNLEKTKSRLSAESEDVKVELDRVHNTSRNLERLLKTTESQLSAANVALESEKREKESLEGNVRRLQSSNNSLTVDLEEKSLQLSSLQKSKADLESELRNLVNEIGDSGRNLHDLDKAKRRLENQVADLENQLEDEQTAHQKAIELKTQLEAQFSEAKKKFEVDFRAKEAQTDEIRRLLMKEVNSLGDQLEETQQQKADILKQKKKVEDQLEEISSHVESTTRGQSDLEKYKKKTDAQIRDLQNRFEEEEKRRKNAEELLDRLEKKSNSLQNEVEALEMQVESFERTKKNLEKKVADLTDEVSGPAEDSKANLLDTKKKLEREIKSLQQRLVEEEDVRSVLEAEKVAAANEMELLRGKTREVDVDKIEKLEESRRALMAAQRLTVQDLEDKTRDNEHLEKQKKVLQAEISDLRAIVENEIAAKCEESAARRKLAVELKDLQAKLDAETLKSTDINDITASYKARIDTLTLQAESSELSKLKAEKMESNLRSQLRELEDHIKFIETDRRHLEDKVKILETQVNDHNSKQEDDAVELSDLKVSRKRLQEELVSLQERKAKEIEERDLLLDQTKKKFQKEIKQLISDLDSEKIISIRAKEVNNDLEQEIDSVSNKLEAELRLTAVLKKEKERLELKVEEVIRSNNELGERLEENLNHSAHAESQLRELKSNLEDSEAQRGLLEKSKKTLESRLEELGEQYSSADRSRNELTKSVLELDQKAVDLRDSLEELQDQAKLAAEKLHRAEQQLQDSATDLNKERDTAIELERAKVLLEKQVKELNSRVFELEAASLTSSAGSTKRLEARINELMGQIEFEMTEKSELQKNARKLERTLREMQFQVAEKDKVKQRFEEDIEKLDLKLKKMKVAMDELETSESNAQLAKRKAEREAADYRERSLRLEKEVEKVRKTTELDAVLTSIGWPATKLTLTPDLVSQFKYILLKLLSLYDLLSQAKVKLSHIQSPLHLVFREVLVHFKYHFYMKKSTNRVDKPEWMLRYALKVTEDHGAFLDIVQDILNEQEKNQLSAKTEYIAFLMTFLKEKIQSQAFQLIDDSSLFSHLVTEAMRFDKTLDRVYNYGGNSLLAVFFEEPELFKCWLAIERDAALYRFTEIMAKDPYTVSLSSVGQVKHTSSSEKLVDLLAVITERYRGLPSQYQIAFFEELQVRILQTYLIEAKATLNKYQSNFVPSTAEEAMQKKLGNFENVLRVAGSLEVIVDILNEWSEDIVFLEMLKFSKSNDFNLGTNPLNHSVFSGISKDYTNVIGQIESIVSEDCLQLVVESMWLFDQRKWSGDSVHEGGSFSAELKDALNCIRSILALFNKCLPNKLCKGIHRALLVQLSERILIRPISKYNFSHLGALQLERDVAALISQFPATIVKQTKNVKRLHEALFVLVLDREEVVNLYHQLFDSPTSDQGAVLQQVGIYRLSVEEVRLLLKKRVE